MSPVMPFYLDPGAAAEHVFPDFAMKANEIITNKYTLECFVRGFFGKARVDGGGIAVVLELRLCARAAIWTGDLLHVMDP